jgi:hypothetical protein
MRIFGGVMSRKPSLPKVLRVSIRARGKGNDKGNDRIAAGNALISALYGALAMTTREAAS